MTRWAWALVVALGAGCTASFDVGARHYSCVADGGAAQCPGGWRCNDAWGRCIDPAVGGAWPCREASHCGGAFRCSTTRGQCFDPDAGAPLACATDSDCGGGWRCAPSGGCVDPAVEGKPSVASGAPTASLLHPRLPLPAVVSPRFRAAATAETDRTRMHAVGWFTSDGPDSFAVLTVAEARNQLGWAVGTLLTRLALRSAATPGGTLDGLAFALSVSNAPGMAVAEVRRLPPGINVHVALEDGGVRTDDLPGLTVSGVLAARVDPALVARQGVVAVLLGTEWRLYPQSSSIPLESHSNAARPAPRELALLRTACGQVMVVASDSAVTLYRPDGGADVLATSSAELRIRRTRSGVWVAWRPTALTAGGEAHWLQVPDDCGPLPDGGVYSAPGRPGRQVSAFDLVEGDATGEAWLVRETLGVDGGQVGTALSVHDGIGERVEVPITTRLSTREASWPFTATRTTDVGLSLSLGPSLLAQASISLGAAPLTIVERDGGVLASTAQDMWQLRPEGWFLAQRFNSAADVVAANVDGLRDGLVTRGGRIVLPNGQFVFPEQAWDEPRQVLAVALRAQDAGLVVVTHDDSFDVWEDASDLPFEPRLRPSPGFAIQSLALRAVTDGGFAEGYLATEDAVFRVAAPSARRWSAARLELPGARPVHVWFERGLPRALLEDGVVIGLTTRLSLTAGLPDPVVAGARACGVTYALTTEGLFQLESQGWNKVPLGTLTADTQPSRLFAGERRLYVFARNGRSWAVERTGPCAAD